MALETVQQLLAWQPPEVDSIIEGGILLPETRMMIFGPPKGWKSMLALHTAFSLAEGSSWFGYKTTRCFPVLIQAELPKSVYRKRLIKFVHGRGGSYPSNFLIENITRLKLDTRYGKDLLEHYIKAAQQLAGSLHMVFILDCLYKLMSGHISDEYDVKMLLDNLDELKDKYKLSFVIVHHVHKTRFGAGGAVIDLGPEESMGSSYFGNWVDTMIRVKLLDQSTTSKRTEMSFELTRNAEDTLNPFRVEWSRQTLQPKVTKRLELQYAEEDITVKIGGD